MSVPDHPLICSLLISPLPIHQSVPKPAFPFFSTQCWWSCGSPKLTLFWVDSLSGESCPSQDVQQGKANRESGQACTRHRPCTATRQGSSRGPAKQHCLGLESGLLSLWKASRSTLLQSERSSHALLASLLHLRMSHEVHEDSLAHFEGHCTRWSSEPGFLSL